MDQCPAQREHRGMVDGTDQLHVVAQHRVRQVPDTRADQRPLAELGAHRVDHRHGVGGGFHRHAAEAEIDGRLSVGDPVHDVGVGIGLQFHRHGPDQGLGVAVFGRQPGEQHLVVGLDFQRTAVLDAADGPHRGRWQPQAAPLDVLGLLEHAPVEPLADGEAAADQRQRQRYRQHLAVGAEREVVQGGQRDVEMLGDVGGDLLVGGAGEEQIRVRGDLGQGGVHVLPALGHVVPQFAHRIDGVLDAQMVAKDVRIELLLRIHAVAGGFGKTRRSDE